MADPVYFNDAEEKNPNAVNLKRVFGRILRHWYVVVLSLLIAFTIAFLVNRYAERVYPSHISILIKETEEASGSAELLYNNALINPYRNFFNEVYVIRSIPLLQEVVEDLNFMISYHQQGKITSSEIYNQFPFVTVLLSDTNTVNSRSYGFKIIDNEQFELSKGDKVIQKASFNDSLNIEGVELIFLKDPDALLHKFFDVECTLVINNSLSLASRFASRLNIEWAEEGSSVVNISLTGNVPEKNVDFLNQLAVAYAEKDLEEKVETSSRSIAFIESQLDEIEDSLRIYETKLENFKTQNYTTELDTRAAGLLTKLEQLENEKAEIQLSQNYFDYLREYINKPDNTLEQVVLPSMVGINDEVINNLLSNLLEIQNKISRLPDQVEKNNPLVKPAYEQIREINRQIKESVKNIEATQQIKLKTINTQLQAIEGQLANLPGTQRRLITINMNYKFSERLFDFLIQKRTEAQISKASATSDIFVVNPAMSGGALYPDIKKNYSFAALAGFALPIFIFFLLEFFNRRIQSKEDIESVTNIPIIGTIGHAKSHSNLLVHQNPRSAIAEGFRAVRSNLNYFTENKDKKVFLVTSSISGEGKTFTTINLATVLAYSGKKTLIMGADMRRPRIYDDFDLKNNVGLSSYLSDQKPLEECMQETFIENLSLFPAGPVPPNPSELLMRKKFKDMLAILLAQFDYILIDSPPLGLVADAMVMAKYVDHVVYITRQNVTPIETLINAEENYKSGKFSKTSILFNDLKKTGMGYGYGYYYGYGNKYGYYEDKD